MIGRADIEGSKSNVRYERLAATSQLSLCRIPLVRTSSELAVRRPGKAPRRSRSQSVPRPARGDPLSLPRKQLEQSADSRRVSGLGPPCPALRANPFPRGYGSILPTSLAYIVPSTRGCSPWRPDAVMSTTGRRGRHSVLPDFQGPPGAHRTTAAYVRCSSAAGPYLRLSRFQGGQAVKQKR
ncbi:hypothetical protein L1887_63142 [Cichorium endivia]|nr:hypothetical protein L1887_63142 [Cichorium endivia]